jgi:ligand-binding SRPBCC domain-containing protein
VIDNDTIARTFGPAPYQAPENPVSNTWTVVDSPANLPAVTPEWNVVNLPGVLMSTTTPETAALTELSKTSVRTIIINSAVWAALLTGIGAALETFVIHH